MALTSALRSEQEEVRLAKPEETLEDTAAAICALEGGRGGFRGGAVVVDRCWLFLSASGARLWLRDRWCCLPRVAEEGIPVRPVSVLSRVLERARTAPSEEREEYHHILIACSSVFYCPFSSTSMHARRPKLAA